jgi:hypothetical protein
MSDTTQAPLMLGQVLATPGAMGEFSVEEIAACVVRHESGDWGDINAADKARNDVARAGGSRLLSSYRFEDGRKLWIITEAENADGERLCTTVLLPAEY